MPHATPDTIQPPVNPLTEDSKYLDVFPNHQNAQFDSLYDAIVGTLDDINAGYDTDYAAGICHTLRLLGMFDDADISRWSVTPYRIAYQEMLSCAGKVIARQLNGEV